MRRFEQSAPLGTLVSTTAHDTELYHNVITRLNESLNEPTPTEDVHALINEVASESQSIIEKQHSLLKTLKLFCQSVIKYGSDH